MRQLTAGDSAVLRAHLDHLRMRNLRPATITARRTVVTIYAKAIPCPLLDAGRDEVEAWQDSLRVSASSRETYTNHVRGFYRWCLAYERISVDPSARLVTPKLPQRLPRPIPEEDLALALRCADPRMRCWLILSAYAGLRAGEIARLRREHVGDRERPSLIHVFNGKAGKDRIVPVGARVIAALRPSLLRQGPLWLNDHGRAVTAAYVSHQVSDFYRSLGMPYTCHSGRHRFASQLYQLSGDLRMCSDVLGHSSPATTAIYTAWSPKVATAAVEQLDQALTA